MKKKKELMGENISFKEEKKGGSNLVYSIKFQTILVNLLIFVAFIICAFSAIFALYKLKSQVTVFDKTDIKDLDEELARKITDMRNGNVIWRKLFRRLGRF